MTVKKRIILDLDEDVRRDFKIACLDYSMSMKDFLTEKILTLIEKHQDRGTVRLDPRFRLRKNK